MERNNETIRLAKKAADAWRTTDTYHQAAQIIDMLISALEGDPTLPQPSNEPLTLEQLREMDGPVWVACKPIEGGNGYWCLCQHGHIITPAGSIYDVKEIPHWVFYRRPPEGELKYDGRL